MKKIVSIIKMDLLLIKQYFKINDIIIILIMSFIGSYYLKANSLVVLMYGILWLIFLSFTITQKKSVNGLYTVLAIERKKVVLARYLFSIIFSLLAIIITNVYTLSILKIMQKPFVFKEVIFVSFFIFVVFSCAQVVVLPLYFMEGKKYPFGFAIMNVMMSLFVVVFSNSNEINNLMNYNSYRIMIIVILVSWIILMRISYPITIRIYNKRDF